MKKYVWLSLIITVFMTFEYWALNHHPAYSLLVYAKKHLPLMAHLNLTTEAGKPISYILGWLGFGVMLLTNFYVFRKRLPFMRR